MGKFQITVETQTWEKDNYDLFDYESQTYILEHLIIKKPGEIYRKQNNCVFV